MDTASVVSDTDHMLFTVLSNPNRVDLNQLAQERERNLQYDDGPRIEDITDHNLSVIPEQDETLRAHDVQETNNGMSYGNEGTRGGEFEFRTEHRETNEQREESRGERREEIREEPREEPRMETHEERREIPREELREETRDEPNETQSRTQEARSSSPSQPQNTQEDEFTKRTLLLDLRQLELAGIKLSKEWTMEDSVSDMMLEMRRLTLAMDETSNVNMMRDGMRLLVTGIEMVNNRIGLLDLDGWSAEVCRDLKKHDANLSRIYRKYWKRSHSTSPEVDICMSLIGSMGLFHMKRSMSKQILKGASGGTAPFSKGFTSGPSKFGDGTSSRGGGTPDSSDDEAPP